MNEFQKYETKGRIIFEDFLKQAKITDWRPTTNQYDFVDGYFTIKGKQVVVEIKTRDVKYAQYSSHLIQIDKYMNLTKAKTDNKCSNALYVNIFGDNIIYIYDLKYINASNCRLVEKYVNKTTAIDKGKKNKQFYEIPSKYAQIFIKENNKWKKL